MKTYNVVMQVILQSTVEVQAETRLEAFNTVDRDDFGPTSMAEEVDFYRLAVIDDDET